MSIGAWAPIANPQVSVPKRGNSPRPNTLLLE